MRWVKIDGFPTYSISENGNVRNDKTGRMLKIHTGSHKYYMVNLWKNNKGHWKTIHRLLALHFIPNPENKRCVNHVDGNRQNNSIENLEWCTYSENQLHRSRVLHKTRMPIEAINANKRAIQCVETGVIYESVSEAARQTRLYQANISKVLNGEIHTTGGFHWRFM